MLKKLLITFTVLIPTLIVGSCLYSVSTIDKSDLFVKRDTVCIVDTVIKTDTVYIKDKNKYFKSFDDILLFLAYLKTQSNRLDDDNWTVIHTLFNRMDKENCNWRKYFYTPSINHSRTIRMILSGELNASYNLSSSKDRLMLERVIDAYLGHNPTKVPKNVLYFESYKTCPNRGIFKKDSIWKQFRHKFYVGNINRK